MLQQQANHKVVWKRKKISISNPKYFYFLYRHTWIDSEAVLRARGCSTPEKEIPAKDKAARERLDELHQWCLRFASPKEKA